MTLDDLFAFCVGTIGMSVSDFYVSTYKEIQYIIHGYKRRIYDRSRESWDQARHIAFFAVVPHVKRGSVSGPKTLMPMPWDIEKAQFKSKADEQAAKDNVIEKLQFRIDKKRRNEIIEKTKQQRKNGRKSR